MANIQIGHTLPVVPAWLDEKDPAQSEKDPVQGDYVNMTTELMQESMEAEMQRAMGEESSAQLLMQ